MSCDTKKHKNNTAPSSPFIKKKKKKMKKGKSKINVMEQNIEYDFNSDYISDSNSYETESEPPSRCTSDKETDEATEKFYLSMGQGVQNMMADEKTKKDRELLRKVKPKSAEATDSEGDLDEESLGEDEEQNDKILPRYVVNLDAPSETRWNEIIDAYKDKWSEIEDKVEELWKKELGLIFGKVLPKLVTSVLSNYKHLGGQVFGEELKAVANRSGMSLNRVLLLQLACEAAASCTMMVIPAETGTYHALTGDYPLTSHILKPLLMEVEFKKEGHTVILGTSFAGYIGILTGIRPGSYSVAVNAKRTKGTLTNFQNIWKRMTKGWPAGFLVREVLESTTNFSTAVSFLSSSALMSPCYISVCGCKPNEGVLLTRDREKDLNRWNVDEKGSIVQSNVDYWVKDPPDIQSSARKDRATKQIKMFGPELDVEELWKLLQSSPIENLDTLYYCIMQPSCSFFEARLSKPQKLQHQQIHMNGMNTGKKKKGNGKCNGVVNGAALKLSLSNDDDQQSNVSVKKPKTFSRQSSAEKLQKKRKKDKTESK